MRRLFFLVLSFFFASLNCVNASDSLYTQVETEAPFDAKFVHANGTRECYLIFSSYNQPIDKEILFEEAHDSIAIRYGEKFWKKINFSNRHMNHESDHVMAWAFSWHTDAQVEEVLVYSFTDSITDPNSCCCILLLDKGKRDDFDLDSSIKSLSKDMQLFVFSILETGESP